MKYFEIIISFHLHPTYLVPYLKYEPKLEHLHFYTFFIRKSSNILTFSYFNIVIGFLEV